MLTEKNGSQLYPRVPVGVGSIVRDSKKNHKMITFDPFIFTSLSKVTFEKLTLITYLFNYMHRFAILRLDRTLYPITLVSRKSMRRASVNARVNL